MRMFNGLAEESIPDVMTELMFSDTAEISANHRITKCFAVMVFPCKIRMASLF